MGNLRLTCPGEECVTLMKRKHTFFVKYIHVNMFLLLLKSVTLSYREGRPGLVVALVMPVNSSQRWLNFYSYTYLKLFTTKKNAIEYFHCY